MIALTFRFKVSSLEERKDVREKKKGEKESYACRNYMSLSKMASSSPSMMRWDIVCPLFGPQYDDGN